MQVKKSHVCASDNVFQHKNLNLTEHFDLWMFYSLAIATLARTKITLIMNKLIIMSK